MTVSLVTVNKIHFLTLEKSKILVEASLNGLLEHMATRLDPDQHHFLHAYLLLQFIETIMGLFYRNYNGIIVSTPSVQFSVSRK